MFGAFLNNGHVPSFKRLIEFNPLKFFTVREHRERVRIDGGTQGDSYKISPILQAINRTPSGNLLPALKFFSAPHLGGYKLNGTKVSKIYNTAPIADCTQSTATRQPLILPYNNERYISFNHSLRLNYVRSNISVGTTTNGFEMVFKLNPASPTLRFGSDVARNSRTMYYSNNDGERRIILASIDVNGDFQIRSDASSSIFGPVNTLLFKFTTGEYWYKVEVGLGTTKHYSSPDGNSWTLRYTYNSNGYTGTAFTGGHILGATTTNPLQVTSSLVAYVGDIYYFHIRNLDNGSIASRLDLQNYNQSKSETTWPSTVSGETWTMTKAADGAPMVIVERTKVVADGELCKIQSGAVSISGNAFTFFLTCNWLKIQAGTRYLVHDSGDKIRIYYDGTNIYVGDSANQLLVGAKPTGLSTLTWVKNGASSFAQFNKATGVTGNSGTLIPTDITLFGNYGNDTNNSATEISYAMLFEGVLDAQTRSYIQDTINASM